MIETETIMTSPLDVQSTINQYENFGWELKSSQIVSHSEPISSSSIIDGLYVYNNYTDEYFSLTFQRDTKMENYLELVKLENQFNNLNSQLKKIKPIVKPKLNLDYEKEHKKGNILSFISLVIFVSGIFLPICKFVIGNVDLPTYAVILFTVFYILFGIGLLVYGIFSLKISKDHQRIANEEYENQTLLFYKRYDEYNKTVMSIRKTIEEVKNKAWMLTDI